MASSTFVINNDAAVATTFTLQSQDLKSATYIDTATNLQEPLAAVISHDVKPTGSKGSDRHTVSFKRVKLNSMASPAFASVSVTITVPRETVITDTMIQDLRAYTVNYLTNARVANLIDGITP